MDMYRLLCRSPALSFPGENITVTVPKEVHFGFNLDNVVTWRNYSKRESVGPFLYYPDPIVDTREGTKGEIKYSLSEPLVIEVGGDNSRPIKCGHT